MKHTIPTLALILTAALAGGCRPTPVIELDDDPQAAVKENMINANRVVIRSELTEIENYLRRRGWEAEEISDGIRLRVEQPGSGSSVQPDDRVVVTYRLEGLDGEPFYTRQRDTINVGRREATPALDAVVQRLRYGTQRTVAVAPSNSAYGVPGDGDRVKSRTVVVYLISDIEPLTAAPRTDKARAPQQNY